MTGTEEVSGTCSIDSVLNDVKDFCGVMKDDHSFDPTICGCIDTAMSFLYQLGVIPQGWLKPVQNDSLTWSEFFSDQVELSMAKSYVKAKVRLSFDPPASATILNALQQQVDEFEWRSQFASEYPVAKDPE